MAQINLLKQPDAKNPKALPMFFCCLMGLVFIGLIAYYAYLFLQVKKISADTTDLQTKISADKQSIMSIPQRNEVLTRQVQLKDMNDLISKHLYWSQLFPQIAGVTLNTASYTSMRLSPGNTVVLSATVPSLNDLDLYLQVFDLPQVYKNFNHVKISGYTKQQDKNATSIKFEATIQYDPSLIKYSDPNKPSAN